MTEFQDKQKTIHNFMVQHQVDALLLQRISSFAWATCGAASTSIQPQLSGMPRY